MDPFALLALGAFQTLNTPKEPVESAGVKVGEVVAWRSWRLQGEHLLSRVVEDEWIPDEPMVGNTSGPHAFGCGVHAFKNKADAEREYGFDAVIGQIALWGDIVEHERGYRAEYGYPLSFISIEPDNWRQRRALKKLRKKWGLT